MNGKYVLISTKLNGFYIFLLENKSAILTKSPVSQKGKQGERALSQFTLVYLNIREANIGIISVNYTPILIVFNFFSGKNIQEDFSVLIAK